MKILAIETSCDETSIAVLEAKKDGSFNLLSNIVSSQVKIHAPYGGVVPMLAKREHQRNLLPVLKQALEEAGLLSHSDPATAGEESRGLSASAAPQNAGRSFGLRPQDDDMLKTILHREPELLKKLLPFLKKYVKPKIDLIAVTNGPGLEPALWVGVNFAKALAAAWNLPVIPVNHVEAHIISNWLTPISENHKTQITNPKQIAFPIMGLIVSGGHTQLILMPDFGKYEILGETRDDAAGEAFDKLAKMLNLGYPGGPIVAELAKKAGHPEARSAEGSPTNVGNEDPHTREILRSAQNDTIKLPRPMINSGDYDFSFSGLKTAALYFVKTLDKKTLKKLTPAICAEFQQAAVDVLVSKTIRAAKEFKARTIMLSGGVASNDLLRETLKLETEKLKLQTTNQKLNFSVPPKNFCTDNAAMIALTAMIKIQNPKGKSQNYKLKVKSLNWQKIQADGNLRLA